VDISASVKLRVYDISTPRLLWSLQILHEATVPCFRISFIILGFHRSGFCCLLAFVAVVSTPF